MLHCRVNLVGASRMPKLVVATAMRGSKSGNADIGGGAISACDIYAKHALPDCVVELSAPSRQYAIGRALTHIVRINRTMVDQVRPIAWSPCVARRLGWMIGH